jgi:diguanylate cyclase (GGDEF)-like protein
MTTLFHEHIENRNHAKLAELLTENSTILDEISGDIHNITSTWFYCFLINFLTSIDVKEGDARDHYLKILVHRIEISQKIGRDVGIRVAAMDYFVNIDKKIFNPKVVEVQFFENLLRMTREDPKTGCFNEKFLREFADREIKRSKRNSESMSVIMIDIDDFKKLNDRYGHLFGDQVIKKFAEIIIENARREDIVARFGGDEFAVILPQTGRIGARSYAERLRINLIKCFTENKCMGESVAVSFSAGIATYPRDGATYEELVHSADTALYRSKDLGKNRVFDSLENEFHSNMNEQDRRQFSRFRLNQIGTIEMQGFSDIFSLKGKVVDMSIAGVLIECNAVVSEKILNQPIEFKLPIDQNFDKTIDMNATVVRLNKEAGRMKFYVGMKFDQLLEQESLAYLESAVNVN